MPDFFARKRVLRDRSRILRGVYEENLLIARRGSNPAMRRKRSLSRRVLAYGIVCAVMLLLHGLDVTPVPSRSSDEVETPMIATDEIVVTAAPLKSVSVAELRTLEQKSDLPLSRMLGLGVHNIVIDAGHGGDDLGAIGKTGIAEKDITLDIARKLKARLQELGYPNVFMTREDDSAVLLAERVAFAQSVEADLFLSIHVNWLPNTPVNLIETFYFGPSRDKRVLELAGQENRGSEYGLNDFKEILARLGTVMKVQESREFAESIQESLFVNSSRKNRKIRDNGVKRAPFVVLLGLDVPSVLAEISCLSNPAEELRLKTEQHRRDIAWYLAEGISNYLNTGAEDDFQ